MAPPSNWGTKNLFKGSIRSKFLLGLIPCASGALEVPSNLGCPPIKLFELSSQFLQKRFKSMWDVSQPRWKDLVQFKAQGPSQFSKVLVFDKLRTWCWNGHQTIITPPVNHLPTVPDKSFINLMIVKYWFETPWTGHEFHPAYMCWPHWVLPFVHIVWDLDSGQLLHACFLLS